MSDGAALPLDRAGEVPEVRHYAKLDTLPDGSVAGRWRRKADAEFEVWELPGGTVVRYRRKVRGRVVEDHLFDAAGGPLVTVTLDPARATLATVPAREIDLSAFAPRPVPGGTLGLPADAVPREGGGVSLPVLGGQLEVWTEPAADVLSDAWRDGLLAACGCRALDRATAWIDGRPGVRYRLLLPGPAREAVELWAVPLPEATWLLAFRAPAGDDAVAAVLPARALLPGAELGHQLSAASD